MSVHVRFTTHTENEIDEELLEDGVDRIEVIEGLYGGLMLVHAARTRGTWNMVVEWDDGHTADIYRFDPIPGPH